MGFPRHRVLLHFRVVHDVLLARLSFHLCRLAFLRLHDHGFVRRAPILHRLRVRLSA